MPLIKQKWNLIIHTRNVFTDNEGHIVRLKPEWYDKIQKVYAADKAAEEM